MANFALCGLRRTTATDFVSFLSVKFHLENLASILEVDEKLNMYFNIYSDAPENERVKEVESNIFGGSGSDTAKEENKFFI